MTWDQVVYEDSVDIVMTSHGRTYEAEAMQQLHEMMSFHMSRLPTDAKTLTNLVQTMTAHPARNEVVLRYIAISEIYHEPQEAPVSIESPNRGTPAKAQDEDHPAKAATPKGRRLRGTVRRPALFKKRTDTDE